MITIFKVRTKINYFKNVYKFYDNESIFTFLAQTNAQIDRQTLNCRTLTRLTIVASWIRDLLSNNNKNKCRNLSTHSKVMAEKRYKKDFDVAL